MTRRFNQPPEAFYALPPTAAHAVSSRENQFCKFSCQLFHFSTLNFSCQLFPAHVNWVLLPATEFRVQFAATAASTSVSQSMFCVHSLLQSTVDIALSIRREGSWGNARQFPPGKELLSPQWRQQQPFCTQGGDWSVPLVGRGGWKGSLTACGGKNVAIGGPMQSGTGSGFLGKQCLSGKTAGVHRSSGDAEQQSENGGKFHPGFRWGDSMQAAPPWHWWRLIKSNL